MSNNRSYRQRALWGPVTEQMKSSMNIHVRDVSLHKKAAEVSWASAA